MDTPIDALAFIYSIRVEFEGADNVSAMESNAFCDVRTSHASHHHKLDLRACEMGPFRES